MNTEQGELFPIDKKPKKHGSQGCFRPVITRPWRWKGGRKAAQKRYVKNNRDKINKRGRKLYLKNREEVKEKHRKYVKANKEKVYEYNRRWGKNFRVKIRAEMINAYGEKCVCCGEKEEMFLELDHINNDGAIRRKFHKNQFQEWLFLRINNWPKENHQLLCANCNKGKMKNGGICPHKKKDP